MGKKVIKGLTIEIGGDTTKLGKALDDVEKRGNALSSELKEINKLLKLDPKNTELLAQKQKVLADAIKNTESKLDTLREAEKQVQAQFERGEVSEAQYRALQREIVATEGKLNSYKNAAKETAETEKNLADGADKAGKELDDAGESSKDAGKDFGVAEAAAAALAAAIVAVGAASVEAFNEVDDGADNVIRATGATGLAAEKLSASYKKVAGQVVGSFEDIGATVGEVNTRFGYTGEQLEKCSVDFLKFAEITGVNSTDAVKSVTRALNDAGIPLDQYKVLLDQLAKAGQAAGIDVTKLAEGLSTNGATMRSMGFDLAESIALLAQFELSGADVTTMLSGMKKGMATWAKEGKDGGEEFQKMLAGIKDGSISAADAVTVFGTRAGPQLVDAIQSGKFEYEDMLNTLSGSHGTLEATFKELEDGGYSSEKSMQRVKIILSDLGEEVLENTAPALEELVDYLEESGAAQKLGDAIRTHVVPALKTISSWVGQNGPAITSMVAGAAAAFVAYKVAVVAATVAQKGLKGAIMATTVAQKALDLVQKSNPWGLALAAVTALTVALIAYAAATKDAKKPAYELTEEEKKLRKAVDEATEAFQYQRKATEDAFRNTSAEMNKVQELADELRGLADASGRVKEEDQARAAFILGELNNALGTEYEQVGGLIKGYEDLKKSVDQVILSKTANALLEAANADYVAALQNENDAWNDKNVKLKEYQDQLAATEAAEAYYYEIEEQYIAAREAGNEREAEVLDAMLLSAGKAWNDEKALLNEKQTAYEDAEALYSDYQTIILNYEHAQEEAIKGNYQTAVDIYGKKGELYTEYSSVVDTETAKVLATLQKEAEDAAIYAEQTRKNYENGVEGYTEAMVIEAEEAYKEALGKFGSAYSEAYGLGGDFGQGIADGIAAKTGVVGAAAVAQIREAIDAAKREADIRSPSRRARKEIGAQLGEGNALGIKDSTPNVQREAKNQIAAVIDAYQAPASTGQQTFRSIADQQAARYTSEQAAINANGPMLERILEAIERGQVLTLDGDAIVGGTADRMDSALGRRRALAARGATR